MIILGCNLTAAGNIIFYACRKENEKRRTKMKKQKRTLLTMLTIVMLCALLSFVASCGGCAGCATADKTSLLKFKSDGKNYEVVIVDSADGTVTLPKDPEKNGYKFDGWFFDENKWETPLKTDSKIKEDTEVFAKWSLVTYSITYKDIDDNVLDIQGYDLPTEYTVESEDIALGSYYKEGYRLMRQPVALKTNFVRENIFTAVIIVESVVVAAFVAYSVYTGIKKVKGE